MAGGESIVPPMIHQCANEFVIANSKSDWKIQDSAWMDRELSQDLMEPMGCGGIPARSGSKSSMILKNNCL